MLGILINSVGFIKLGQGRDRLRSRFGEVRVVGQGGQDMPDLGLEVGFVQTIKLDDEFGLHECSPIFIVEFFSGL